MKIHQLFSFLLLAGLVITTGGCKKTRPAVLELFSNWEIQSSDSVWAGGADISGNDFRTEKWYGTTVPATVLAALVENKVYPDPYYGENLKAIPGYKTGSWISMDRKSPFYKPWWYRTSFEIPKDWSGRNMKLHLNGINLKANVWLNGKQIADTSSVYGMFKRFEFGIEQYVKPGEVNTLAIEIFAPGRIPDIKYYTKQVEATTGWDDHNPQPPDLNMGVWQKVFITAEGPVSLRHPYVVTDLDLPSLDVAHLTVSARLINRSAKAVTGKLVGKIENIRFEKTVTLDPEETLDVRFDPSEFPQLNIEKPRIWWPHTVGAQELYDLKLSFISKGSTSSEETTRFGIREVETYINDEGWRGYRVNGKNILIRGGAWMTSDMLLRFTPERYEGLVRYAKEAGLNALRSEGFSIRETDEFYSLCDKYGVLVIQQFFGRNLPDEKLAVSIIEDMLLRIRNHPSLIHFLGHDETFPTRSLDSCYRQLIEKYTPERTYQPHSGAFEVEERFETGGTRTGTLELWAYANPSRYYIGKEDGAWGFAQSGGIGGIFAPYESMAKTVPESALWPVENETFSFHTVLQGLEYFQAGLDAIKNRYGKPKDIIDFCDKAMALNYESARGMFEAYARNKYAALGITTWKYDAAWPAVCTWQYVDWYLNVGGAYYGAKKACEPLHVQYSYDDNSVWIVNSYYKGFTGLKATATIYNFDLTEKANQSSVVDIGSDGKTQAFKIDFPSGLSRTFFLRLKLQDNTGTEVSDNFYWLSTVKDIEGLKLEGKSPRGFDWDLFTAVPRSVSDFTLLESLPDVEIERSFELNEDTSGLTGTVKLKNKGANLAFMIRLALINNNTGDEINPVYWDTNYLSLFPGESKELKVRFDKKSQGSSVPVLKVTGWNVRK